MDEEKGGAVESAPEVVAVQRDGDALPILKPLTWWQSILIRAVRAGLSAGGGLWGGGALGIVNFPERERWSIILTAAAAAFCWSMLQNTIELLARLDQTNPKLRA